jgi:type II secretory pathway component HofQ
VTAPLATLLIAGAALVAPAPPTADARVSLDVKDAPVTDVVLVLAEVGRFQVVFDPGPSCSLTLKLREAPWRLAFDAALRACRLAYEEEGGVMRVASVERLSAESADERKLSEERARSAEHTVSTFRLSYARAAEMAPIVKRLLSPRGDVVFDARTNTLIIVD